EWVALLQSMTSRLASDRPSAAAAARRLRAAADLAGRPEPTLVLPAQVPVTEPMDPQADTQPEPVAESPAPKARHTRLRPAAWATIGAVILVPVMAFAVSGLISAMQPPQQRAAPVLERYPAIEGVLGDHL